MAPTAATATLHNKATRGVAESAHLAHHRRRASLRIGWPEVTEERSMALFVWFQSFLAKGPEAGIGLPKKAGRMGGLPDHSGRGIAEALLWILKPAADCAIILCPHLCIPNIPYTHTNARAHTGDFSRPGRRGSHPAGTPHRLGVQGTLSRGLGKTFLGHFFFQFRVRGSKKLVLHTEKKMWPNSCPQWGTHKAL